MKEGRVELVPILLLAAFPAAVGAQKSDVVEPDSIVMEVATQVKRRYVFADAGARMAERLRAGVEAGAYDGISDGEALARRLTEELRAASGDGHLSVEYSATPLPEEDAAARAEMEERDRTRYYGPQRNFGFQSVQILEGNIGYLDLRVFAPLDWAGPSATAAMTLLAHADALIVDLRRNGGGHGETVAWLISYLMDETPRPLSGMYSRERDETTQRWTLTWVPGPRYGPERPVYVLTSSRTFSAAEAFAYDLQALGRATIVGERTGGGAHPFENVKIGRHYVLGLPTARSVNPMTDGNWQGSGVQPDVRVAADSALATALRLAAASARAAQRRSSTARAAAPARGGG